MPDYSYKKKTRGIFDPLAKNPFRISRSKIDLFVECQRCFYLDLKLGIRRPSMPAFTLNSAVDHLLKKEFDIHRAKGKPHPLMEQYGVDAVPFVHEKLEQWRHNFTGVECAHKPTNFLVFGAVDDVWVNPKGQLHIVDYKATSKNDKPTLEGRWQQGYKRQMEIYQWLMRGNGFDVSDIGYFVYANGKRDLEAFDGKLEFDIEVIPYKGDGKWIEDTLLAAHKLLMEDMIPEAGELCEHCPYRELAQKELHQLAGVEFKKSKKGGSG